MPPRASLPGLNKKRVNNHPTRIRKLEGRHKKKLLGKKQKHVAAVKAVAGPSRTGKAKRKQAHFLKLKLKDMAAEGKLTAEDFEMADAAEAASPEATAPAKADKKKAPKSGKKKGSASGGSSVAAMVE
mmetsp:Transcript_44040/g.111421  ORF Transcript_44040/g.111421 Transcript_44040/m.111421 type:complete len:128 (+) Transcript_44040:208-591(+)